MAWSNYWLSLMVFVAIICFELAFAIRRDRQARGCDLDEHRQKVRPRAR